AAANAGVLITESDNLSTQIAQAVNDLANIISGLEATLIAQIDSVVAALRNLVAQTVLVAVRTNIVYQLAPSSVQTTILDGARQATDAALNAESALINLPGTVLQNVGKWIATEVEAQIRTGVIDGNRLWRAIEANAYSLRASNFSFPLKFVVGVPPVLSQTIDLGTITVPVGALLGQIIEFIGSVISASGDDGLDALTTKAQQQVDLKRRRGIALQGAAQIPTP